MTTKLDAAKALVAEHAELVNQALSALDNAAAHTASAVSAAVETATADATDANDLLMQQINAASAQLRERFAQAGAAIAAGASAAIL